jgi:signal transduction histidine kinase/CheY-like chemotaxis protein
MLGKDLFTPELFPQDKVFDLTREHLDDEDNKPLELHLMTKSGQDKIISFTGGTLHSISQGETEVWFGTDITHLVELEQGLQEAQKMERLNMILNRMTESLNHLLNEIQSEIRFFKEAGPESKKLDKSMERIEKALSDGIKLRNQILGITDTSDIKPGIINPNTVIEEVSSILNRTKPAALELVLDLKNNEFVEVDKNKFSQVLMNLAINTFEAITKKGKLIIQTRSVKSDQDRFLNTQNDLSNRYVKIVFSDNGSGMDDNIKEHALEPFFTTKKDSPVRGLGLTYGYQIITSHKGFLTIDSEANVGTSVTIYLPAIRKDKDETKRIGTPNGKGTILVVDDEVIIRELLGDILKSQGYRVLTAENGKEGIALYRKNMAIIDLIILDIIMPQMDGKQVYEQIKSFDPEARVLITSGYSKSKILDELLQKGVDGFLPKPFDIEALIKQLENIL